MSTAKQALTSVNYSVEGTEIDNLAVSVILPTFNSSKTIRKAIDSIISQTYRNWEMIVINEFGSDDGTADIVRGYVGKDRRIRLVQLHERLGLAESLNLGLRLSKGKEASCQNRSGNPKFSK